MPTIHLIVAVASNGVIGAAQGMPWHIPEDLGHFKQLTTGHTVIMGRRTYESIGHGLPDRQNIVLSQTMTQCADAQLAVSLEQAAGAGRWAGNLYHRRRADLCAGAAVGAAAGSYLGGSDAPWRCVFSGGRLVSV